MADGNHILQLCLEDTILISLYSLSSSFHLPVSSVFYPPPRYLRRRWVSKNIPVEILTRTNSDQRITIRQRREDTDPIPCQHILLYSLLPPQLLRPSVLGADGLSRGTAQRGANPYSLVRILKLCSYRHDFFLFVVLLSTCTFSFRKMKVLVCVETRGGVFALLDDSRNSGRDL